LAAWSRKPLLQVNRAHQLDPRSRAITLEVGQVYIAARKYDEAMAVLKKLANENPTYPDAHFWLCIAYWGKQMYSRVIEEYKIAAQLSNNRNNSEFASALEEGYRSASWKGALTKGIETLKAQRKTDPSSTYGGGYWIPFMYGQMGEKDQAFRWLDTAYQEREEALVGLKTDFQVDPLRSDPRFADLMRKVGLSQ
jgi:tetratricopeptide (TPR) repeat protein